MRIIYDAVKRQRALDEQGLDFADAGLVLDGFHLTRIDDRKDYRETRHIVLGTLRGVPSSWSGHRATMPSASSR